MKFREKIANYILGNYTIRQLPEIALTGMNENLESESLIILAGLSDKDNSFEIEQYFNNALLELGIRKPNELEAAKIMLIYYLKLIIDNVDIAFDTMSKIDNEIYMQVNWKSKLNLTNINYVGEELGLQFMYTWYRELQDFKDGSKLLYFNEYPREEQKKKFEEKLIEEAKDLIDKLNEPWYR